MKFLAGLLFFLILSFYAQAEFHVFEIKGKAIVRPLEGKPHFLEEGGVLREEEVVVTDKNTTLSILIADRSYLNLGNNTAFKIFKKDGIFHLNLFRGQLRVFHSESDMPLNLVTPVKDLSGKGKMDFVAEVFQHDDLPHLDLVMLRGSFYGEYHRIRSGMRFMGTWEKEERVDIPAYFENKLVAHEKSFISEAMGSRRNFDFEVELEWKKRVAVVKEPEVTDRKIASVEDEAFSDLEEFEEEKPIVVHEVVYDAISVAAGKVMDKLEWYRQNKTYGYDHREEALKLAVEKISLNSFFHVKEQLEIDYNRRALDFSGHIIGENRLELDDSDIRQSLWVVTSQHVEDLIRKTIPLSKEIFPDIHQEIKKKVQYDLMENSREWSYQQAVAAGKNSYQHLLKTYRLNTPVGVDALIEKVARRLSIDFSNRLGATLSDKYAYLQADEVMEKAIPIALPVVQRKLKRIYQASMLVTVMDILEKDRTRAIASQKTEELDKKKIQYQTMEFRSRNRSFLRQSRN